MKRRLARLAALLALATVPAAARAAEIEYPVAVVGALLPADGPAASLLRPARLRGSFRVPHDAGVLYVGTPWVVHDLTLTLVGPGTQRRSLVAAADLPGAVLGVRLPDDASAADRIDLDATTVSSVSLPYLVGADQFAQIAARSWWYAAFFGAYAALAVVFGAAALRLRSRIAGCFAAFAAAQGTLLIPWLGIVRPPPELSQPLHALLESSANAAAALLALAYAGRAGRPLRIAVWTPAAAGAMLAWGGAVLQDFWNVPDAATQAAAVAFAASLVAAGAVAVRAHVAGARWYAAGAGVATTAALAAALPLPVVIRSAAPVLGTAAFAALTALALGTAMLACERRRARAASGPTADGLTGLPNRTAFDAQLAAALTGANARAGLLLIDVDHLHAYNECYGHLAGDDVLRRIAATTGEVASRARAFAARYGGEEFAILLPGADAARCRAVAEDVRLAVSALEIAHGGIPSRRLTVTAGAAWAPADAGTLLRRAADALFVAKAMGRNRVVVDEPGDYAPNTESATVSFTAYGP